MKEKTKKWLVTVGLAAVCVGLVFGISKMLYQEPVQKPVIGEDTGDTEEIVIDIGKNQTTMTGERETEEGEMETKETLVIEIDKKPKRTTASDREQEIQPEPKKTEKEKPSGPPASLENGDAGESGEQSSDGEAKKPVEQPDKETMPKENTPAHGDTKDGMIYVDGFGWIPNEGGGGQGTYAEDMYENGNKIGIMD